jgi:hypothetical protein
MSSLKRVTASRWALLSIFFLLKSHQSEMFNIEMKWKLIGESACYRACTSLSMRWNVDIEEAMTLRSRREDEEIGFVSN